LKQYDAHTLRMIYAQWCRRWSIPHEKYIRMSREEKEALDEIYRQYRLNRDDVRDKYLLDNRALAEEVLIPLLGDELDAVRLAAAEDCRYMNIETARAEEILTGLLDHERYHREAFRALKRFPRHHLPPDRPQISSEWKNSSKKMRSAQEITAMLVESAAVLANDFASERSKDHKEYSKLLNLFVKQIYNPRRFAVGDGAASPLLEAENPAERLVGAWLCRETEGPYFARAGEILNELTTGEGELAIFAYHVVKTNTMREVDRRMAEQCCKLNIAVERTEEILRKDKESKS